MLVAIAPCKNRDSKFVLFVYNAPRTKFSRSYHGANAIFFHQAPAFGHRLPVFHARLPCLIRATPENVRQMKENLMEIGNIKQTDIRDEMQTAYLDYAMSVITSRALPDVRD